MSEMLLISILLVP